MIQKLNKSRVKTGLTINSEKSKILSIYAKPSKIMAENRELETISEIVYLGQLIALENKTDKEMNRRITLAWKKCWSLKNIT